MPRVICTLPNAAAVINGLPFEPHGHGMISGDLTASQAAAFCLIPGYVLVVDEQPPPGEDTPPFDVVAEPAPEPAAAGNGRKTRTTGGKSAASQKEG